MDLDPSLVFALGNFALFSFLVYQTYKHWDDPPLPGKPDNKTAKSIPQAHRGLERYQRENSKGTDPHTERTLRPRHRTRPSTAYA
jgi:hypothetical protein